MSQDVHDVSWIDSAWVYTKAAGIVVGLVFLWGFKWALPRIAHFALEHFWSSRNSENSDTPTEAEANAKRKYQGFLESLNEVATAQVERMQARITTLEMQSDHKDCELGELRAVVDYLRHRVRTHRTAINLIRDKAGLPELTWEDPPGMMDTEEN